MPFDIMSCDVEVVTERATKRAPEAAPRWKARYLHTKRIIATCIICGKDSVIEPGDERVTHCFTWPTRAATDAEAAQNAADAASIGARYLGAIPVGAA